MSEPDFWANRLAVVCDDCGESLARCGCVDRLDPAQATWYEADAFMTVYSATIPPGDSE